jgi:hypothetical protein
MKENGCLQKWNNQVCTCGKPSTITKTQTKDNTEKRYPLTESNIYVKTVNFKKNAITNLGDLKQAMTKKPTKGYCEKNVQRMTQVSNRKLCRTQQNKNVGFYYRVTFPVYENGTTYEF